MYRVDLNCDLGESFGAYTIGRDEEVLSYISSANVACGFHASDPYVMSETVRRAKGRGVRVGAHPGYPDLVGFGRRNLTVSPKELKAMVQYQIGALSAFFRAEGIFLQHVKPHGAMYNMAAKDERLAVAICDAVASFDENLILVGLAGSRLLSAAKGMGLRYASEVFADRAYEDDGSLVSRTKPGAMITDEDDAISRVVTMIREGYVVSVNGNRVPVRADTVCLHGDSPTAVAFAKKIRGTLLSQGIQIAPLQP
ncbi:MAG: LamB/YcsF family protein [Lachnospiraceae bacterium]|nr:LamB/YcsF family protein [Lachnospiraceae bacterium]